MKKTSLLLVGLLFIVFSMGCGSEEPVEVIDLNKVLNILTQTLDELKNTSVEGAADSSGSKTLSQEDIKLFLRHFEKNLNAANLISTPIVTSMAKSGAITGYADKDKNGVQDKSDQLLFTVEMDEKGQRLIARDVQNNYYRDTHYGYHGSGMGGFFTGYLIGSMLTRQHSMGYSPNRFSNMRMAPRNYHQSAVSKARSARSRGGSGSFSSGK